MERMIGQWERHGLGLFSVLRKEDERFVGRIGYLLWDTDRWVNAMHERSSTGISSSRSAGPSRPQFWGNGYATEAAIACRDYAFAELGRERVISLIEPDNVASIRVAEKIGESYERRRRAQLGDASTLYSLGKRPAR